MRHVIIIIIVKLNSTTHLQYLSLFRAHLLTEGGRAAVGRGLAYRLHVHDKELSQLSVVTQTGERGPPVDTAGDVSH